MTLRNGVTRGNDGSGANGNCDSNGVTMVIDGNVVNGDVDGSEVVMMIKKLKSIIMKKSITGNIIIG